MPPSFPSFGASDLSGHMHGATAIDRAGHPIRPCILWNDTRSHVEAASLDADPMFRRLTGNIVFPGIHRAEAQMDGGT
jgi:xylulokinase